MWGNHWQSWDVSVSKAATSSLAWQNAIPVLQRHDGDKDRRDRRMPWNSQSSLPGLFKETARDPVANKVEDENLRLSFDLHMHTMAHIAPQSYTCMHTHAHMHLTHTHHAHTYISLTHTHTCEDIQSQNDGKENQLETFNIHVWLRVKIKLYLNT